MNWRKHPPKRAGMYWVRVGAEDGDPKTIQVIAREGLQVLQLGVTEIMPLDQFVLSKNSDKLQFYGPMRIPKTPIPRRVYEPPPPDPVTERFEKQSDPKVVLAMLNEFLRDMPPDVRGKIPRTLKLPAAIHTGEELEAAFERFDEAVYVWGMENETENPGLDEVARYLRAAWFQYQQIAIEAMPFEDPEDAEPASEDNRQRRRRT